MNRPSILHIFYHNDVHLCNPNLAFNDDPARSWLCYPAQYFEQSAFTDAVTSLKVEYVPLLIAFMQHENNEGMRNL